MPRNTIAVRVQNRIIRHVSDRRLVQVLAQALETYYRSANQEPLRAYSTTCLQRVWKVQRFSWWMTALLHRFDTDNAFDQRRQLAELEYLVSSRAAAQTLAENYVGLPLT